MEGLPEDSALSRAQSTDPWGTQEHLLAVIADRVSEHLWAYAQTHSKTRLTPPEPIPRPGLQRAIGNGHQPDHQSQRKHASVADMRRFFGAPAGR